MSVRQAVTVVWVLTALVLIGGALALAAWIFGSSLNERGPVVLVVFIPVTILFAAACMIGRAWARRLMKPPGLDSSATGVNGNETNEKAGPD